jgi:NADPH:quinone reductase-like Zn-dependent oxidoreductase
VIACTTGEAKRKGVVELGAHHVVDYAHESIRRRVHEITRRAGADVVFEHVGPATWEESIASAAYRGRIVTCGATSGRRAPTDLPAVFAKQLTIAGVTLGSRDDLERILALVAAGTLRPVIDRVLPLEQCRLGHELIEERRHFGKVVLRVGPRRGD